MDPVTILGIVQTLRGNSRNKGVLGMLGIKNLLALVGLVVVVFLVAGWYLGWYKVGAVDDAQGHHVRIQVNSSQITEDLSKGKDKVIMILDKNKGTLAAAPAQTAPPSSPPPTQAYGIPLVPRSTAEIQVPQMPAPQPPPAPPAFRAPPLVPPPLPREVDSWTFPR